MVLKIVTSRFTDFRLMIKNLILALMCALFFAPGWSQNNWCGTDLNMDAIFNNDPAEKVKFDKEWLKWVLASKNFGGK